MRPPRALDRLSVLVGLLTVAATFGVSLLQDAVKGLLPRWAVYVVMVAGLLASGALWWVRRRPRPPGPEVHVADAPLPPQVDLVGRDELVATAVDRLRRSHLLLLHGPRNIGTSAVALEVARQVVPAETAQVYVDLRAREANAQEDAASAKVRVLTALGLTPPRARSDADVREQVRAELAGTGRVLVLDNVRAADQIDWLTRPILGAYVLAAGDVPPRRDVPDLPVGPLTAAGGLALLRRGELADRVRPGGPGVDRLATSYLRSPAVVLAVRSWLAARPAVGVPALLEDLTGRGDSARSEPSSVLRTVLELQTAGLSADAAALLALLPSVPVTFLGVPAAAALLDRTAQRAERALDELARSVLIEAVGAGRYRIPRETRSLGRTVTPRARRAAAARLLHSYAEVAAARVEVFRGPRPLAQEDAPEAAAAAEAWFRTEDLALLALLALLGSVRPETVPTGAARSVAAIADALDVWFARDRRPESRWAAAEAALGAARLLGDPVGRETAVLRLAAVARAQGRLDAAAEHLAEVRPDVSGAAAEARLAAASGAQSMAAGDLVSARQDFETTLRRRPPVDTVGAATDRINLGAVLLAQGELDAAVDRLRQAAAIAADAGDPAGLAHAQELLGVVAARRGRAADALEVWSDAKLLYARVRDESGQARCLLHTGTVLAGRDAAGARAALSRSLVLRDGNTGVGVALAHLQLAGLAADPAEVDLHRAGAYAALAPWEGRIHPPAEVSAVRALLAGLAAAEPTT